MKTRDINTTIIDCYLQLIDNLSPDIKLDLISKLTQSVKSDMKSKKSAFKKAFGGFVSKKSADEYKGRNDQNVTVIFPKENAKPGDYVKVLIESSTTTSIIGRIVN